MEIFGQWEEGDEYYFYHLNRDKQYTFNHWTGSRRYWPASDVFNVILASPNSIFKLTLIYT